MGKIHRIIVVVMGVLSSLPGTAMSADNHIDLRAIAIIESGGNHLAYNAHEGAYGQYQIRAPALADYNKYGPGRMRHLSLTDMYDDLLSDIVADWYLNTMIPTYLHRMKVTDSVNARIIAYNAGISYARPGKKIPATTRAYINMYHDLIKNGGE
jgi:hypothetical protein